MERSGTNTIRLGALMIGGGHPIVVQSMNNTDTRDVVGTLRQINMLKQAGCELTRVAIPDAEAARALAEIVSKSPIPVVADIHFDPRLAMAAIENGAAKIRINPGNIKDRTALAKIAKSAKARGIPIRVGVNSGSLSKEMIRRFGGVNRDSMVFSALEAIRLMEDNDFFDLVVSIKSSDPVLTIESYRLLSKKIKYPLHIGLTEAGTVNEGTIRSSVTIGALLAEGIGDTIRVSLTGDPVEEVRVAYSILKSLSLRRHGMTLVSCPTCGRTAVPLIEIAGRVEDMIRDLPYDLKVAVMGCAVNGPGEAREADIGIAGGDGDFLLFQKGNIIGRIAPDDVYDVLMKRIHELGKNNQTDKK
ncbi:MAG: flavodoxin-dependent (E)-4-hydroxy-3-methylbut-2-enyl-diphosphate synthase [Clostridiaceae bacterium]|nr:flavodoxin-dependent (E)-4-hydroxy-3-methylbut-2-enyl-diphosphate synthase [Clostridiaceae bacterium]